MKEEKAEREKKKKEEIEKSSKQISEKKQDIKYDTRDYVVKFMKQQYESGEFYIPLDYQRKFIWGEKEKCNFIESVLMGLPVPFMFFADTKDGRIEIVDGAQRTQTLVEFAQNDLLLNNLRILTESNGFYFQDLDPAVQRRFLNTNIRVVFLEEGTTQAVRQEIFRRINTGGIHAKASEVRRGALDGKFKRFLEECVKNEKFNKLAPRTEQAENRFEGLELVSRFFTYTHNYGNGFETYAGNVAKYIDEYIEEQNSLWEKDDKIQDKYKKEFEDMLFFAENNLGSRGFRKTEKSKSTPRARFEALSIGIALALQENPDLSVKNVNWMDSDEFSQITRSDAANNKSKLIGRIEFVRKKLLEEER